MLHAQVMTSMAAACRGALLENSPRLVEAMYLCEVSSTAEALAGAYAVLRRRRARILRDDMREGSDTFIVLSYLPIEASFGLADELRKRTSGAASASLLLSHWERLKVSKWSDEKATYLKPSWLSYPCTILSPHADI